MAIDFLQNATINGFKGFGNTLFNGFGFNISERDKCYRVGTSLIHFKPINQWSLEEYDIVDKSTGDKYCHDSKRTVRLKCAALFAASWIVQPIGLSLNLLNKVGKIVSFAYLWYPSQEKYSFKARVGELGKDLFVVASTPLILVGMLFSSLYGATLSPYDGRKLYGSFERLAYSGGYQIFGMGYGGKDLHNFLLAPCFQPEPKAHLGGGALGEKDVW